MQKCQFKNGSFWNKNYITKDFYNLLYLSGLRNHLYKKRQPVYKSFLGDVMLLRYIKYLLERMIAFEMFVLSVLKRLSVHP